VLILRLVFHPALRQAEAFTRSVQTLLGLELRVPDHTTLSRRGRTFAGRQPRARASGGPIHLVLDRTGLELFGQGHSGRDGCSATYPAEDDADHKVISITSGSIGTLSSLLSWNSIQLMRAITVSVSRRNWGPLGIREGLDGLDTAKRREGNVALIVSTCVQERPLIGSIDE